MISKIRQALAEFDNGLSFDRARIAYGALMIMTAQVAIKFNTSIKAGWIKVGPEFYGPKVYAIPLDFWTAVQFTLAICAAIGCFLGGREGAWWALGSSFFLLALFLLLSALSRYTGTVSIMTLVTDYIGLPLTSLIVISALRRLFHA